MRMPASARSLFLGATCLTFGASGGCGPPAAAPPMSPTPEQDPLRYEQARQAEAEAKRRNREAEEILLKRSHLPPSSKGSGAFHPQ